MTDTLRWLRPPGPIHNGWKAEIAGVKDYLGDDTSQEAVDEASVGIVAVLRAWIASEAGISWLTDDERDELEGVIIDLEVCVGEDADELNRVLWDLYEWADGWRYIIGGTPREEDE